MFELQEEESKITKLGPRDEKHGDSDVLAVDVYVHVLMPNTALAMFAPMLRSALFFKRDETQMEMHEDDHRPDVRFPEMKIISWHVQYRHVKLTVHHGSKKKHDIVFEDCTLDRFKLEPRKNGQVLIMFRAQVHPTEEQGARLLALLGQSFNLSIADGDEDENYSQATLDGMDDNDDENDGESTVDNDDQQNGDQPDLTAGDGSALIDEKPSAGSQPERGENWPFPGDVSPGSPAAELNERQAAAAAAKKPRGRRARVTAVD